MKLAEVDPLFRIYERTSTLECFLAKAKHTEDSPRIERVKRLIEMNDERFRLVIKSNLHTYDNARGKLV